MKYVYILNSFGSKSAEEKADIIKKIDIVSSYLGLDYDIEINSKTKSTEDILNKYKDTRNIIVAVGGDGMINKVLNGIVGTKNILSYIPFGTGNDFDRTVNETLKEKRNFIDVVKINDKYFINMACFGIDADIANDHRYTSKIKLVRNLKYDLAIPKHLLTYKPRNMEITIDGRVKNDYYTTVVVGNARYYGNGYKVSPHSLLNDGLVEVYLVKKLNVPNMVKTILSMKDGSHENSQYVDIIKTDSLLISSNEEISSNIDGEILTANEFDIEVMPKEIEVFQNKDLIKKVLRK